MLLTTTIDSTSSPNPIGITSANPYANFALTDLNFYLTPGSVVPNSGYVTIILPVAFTITAITANDCLFSGSTISQSCTLTSNTVKMQLPVALSFPLGTESLFTIKNVAKTPILSGSFLFDITTSAADGTTVLESYSDYLVI